METATEFSQKNKITNQFCSVEEKLQVMAFAERSSVNKAAKKYKYHAKIIRRWLKNRLHLEEIHCIESSLRNLTFSSCKGNKK